MNFLLIILLFIKTPPSSSAFQKLKYLWNNILNFTLITQKKIIYGYIKVGKYGESSEIKDVKLKKVHYRTTAYDVTLKERIF